MTDAEKLSLMCILRAKAMIGILTVRDCAEAYKELEGEQGFPCEDGRCVFNEKEGDIKNVSI